MVETVQIQLDDGTTYEAVVEADEGTEDLFRQLGRLRIATDDRDVEAHASASTLDVIVYGEDDVEGHALTLRLPHAQAARDLQRKLLAAGVVGVIVVGAATTSIWVPQGGTDTGTGAVAAPAPAMAPGLRAEQTDLAAAAAALRASQPEVAPALKAEQADLAATAAAIRASEPEIAPGLKADLPDLAAQAATEVTVPQPKVAPGMKAELEDQASAAASSPTIPAGRGMRPE